MQKDIKKKAGKKQSRGYLAILFLVIIAVVVVVSFLVLKGQEGRTAESETQAQKDEFTDLAESANSVSASSIYADAEEDSEISYNGHKYVYNEDLTNYLFLGIDSSDNVDETKYSGANGQSDAIYLVSYDRRNKSVKTLAIPRDTMTEIEVFEPDGKSRGTTTDHLNLQYAYGDGKHTSCELTRNAVSHLLYGLSIQGYCSLNLSSLPHLAELVQGVQVVVPDNSLENVDPEFQKGATVTLNADNTEEFVRSRDIQKTGSALVRQNRQIVFLKAFAKRVQELQKEDASTVSNVYDGLKSYMVTNMTADDFVNIATASGLDDVTTLPGKSVKGQMYDEYHVDDDALYELMLDMFYKEV